MHYHLSRTILSLVLVFALIGQGLSVASDYCDMTSETNTHVTMGMSDHETMQHGHDMAKQDLSAHNCCDTIECTCLNGTCTSTLIASLEQNLEPSMSLGSKISAIDSHLSAANSQLLIRPPIIA